MVSSFEPIVMTNQEIFSLKYATINYEGQRRISLIRIHGTMHSERGVWAF